MTATARKLALACAMSAGLASMPSYADSAFTEVGDAGQTQATAQVGLGTSGALTDIFGVLRTDTDVDLFVIDIANPGAFSATTVNAGTGSVDTQLFLLTLAGAPVFLNDDGVTDGTSFGSTLSAGSLSSFAAGRYLLGVSGSGYSPANINSQLLFAAGLFTDLRGPASGLQPLVLAQFVDDGYFADNFGSYDIQLTGVAAIPEPATNALLLAGGALCAFVVRRRRSVAVTTAA